MLVNKFMKYQMAEEEERVKTWTALFLFGMHHDTHFCTTKRPRGSESPHDFVLRMLSDPTYCFTMFRMTNPLFHQLHDLLVTSYGLTSTSKSSSIEALGMFLWILGTPQPVRQPQAIFGRSLDTVHRNFAKVLHCMVKLAVDIIKPVDPEFRTIPARLQQPRFSPYFNNCIGAIDGTHIEVTVPNDKVVQHLNRKGKTSQNVLAVCDFDMRFTFVLAGWPGSVHDMRVFNDATTTYTDKFPHPPPGNGIMMLLKLPMILLQLQPMNEATELIRVTNVIHAGKYYLVDSGYPNRPGYLAPYKGTKYHLPEFRQCPMPRGIKETFNFAHSSLRNVVERSFGVLKEKWRMLRSIPSFPLAKQSKIIVACMALHNFIRENDEADEDFARVEMDEEYVDEGHLSDDYSGAFAAYEEHDQSDDNMNAFRDQLAHALYYRL